MQYIEGTKREMQSMLPLAQRFEMASGGDGIWVRSCKLRRYFQSYIQKGQYFMLELDGRGKWRPVTWPSLDGDLWVAYRCIDFMSVCWDSLCLFIPVWFSVQKRVIRVSLPDLYFLSSNGFPDGSETPVLKRKHLTREEKISWPCQPDPPLLLCPENCYFLVIENLGIVPPWRCLHCVQQAASLDCPQFLGR